ncbi:NADAR family protein [Variovorax atrisoli]|uniref:NADAR family protein n=1 Tax=Variovorax atrisoli TaxID=3394203 RepID=UPI000377D9D5|nr:NADAR family protein [Variovorax paradoxus]
MTTTTNPTTVIPRSTRDLPAYFAQGHRPEYLLFWGHQAPKTGVNKSCFSQWFEVAFKVDGVSYRTAEHFMMAGKARLFGDDEVCERILAARTPAEAKKLGREIRGFDEAAWVAARLDIVTQGNIAKFSQNAELGAFLLGTGHQVLVEASPVDPIWGIGLAANDPLAQDPRKWKGLNLLGFALMAAREVLRQQR